MSKQFIKIAVLSRWCN